MSILGQEEQATKRKAVSYIRMSTDAQLQGSSLARQTKLAQDYCLKNNLELVEELQDIGLSGYSGAHRAKGQLGLFFEGLKNGTISKDIVLIVENLDRLSRQDPLTAITQFSDLLSYGVELHTLFDGQVYTKDSVGTNMSQMFMSIGQMMRAYDESQTKSKRLSAAWAKKREALDSEVLTARVPNWLDVVYDKNGKASGFTINEDEAKTIRAIYDLSINQNMGSMAITKHLNQNPHLFPKTKSHKTNKAGGWGESYVKKLMNTIGVYGAFQPRRKVDGKMVPDGDVVKGYYPAVISEEEFLLNQKRMLQRKNNGRGRQGEGFPNLFHGLLICRECGSGLRFLNKGKPPKGGLFLQCSAARQKRSNCGALALRYEPFEELFFTALQDVDFQRAFYSTDYKKQELELEQQLAGITNDIKTLDAKIDAVMENLLEQDSDSIKVRLKAKMNELDNELKEKRQQQQSIQRELSTLNDSKNPDRVGLELDSLLVGGENRRLMNGSLKKLLDVISVDNTPEFALDDVLDGVITVDELDGNFLSWFENNKNKRWEHQDPLEFVGSAYGYVVHQSFRTMLYVHFSSGDVRIVYPDGKNVRLPEVPKA